MAGRSSLNAWVSKFPIIALPSRGVQGIFCTVGNALLDGMSFARFDFIDEIAAQEFRERWAKP